jgi:hypothetical protein
MSDLRIVFHPDAEKDLRQSAAVARALRAVADKVQRKVRAPKHLTLSTRAGVGRRGAFAQVIMAGSGALAVEFGTRTNVAIAPLRRALRGGIR